MGCVEAVKDPLTGHLITSFNFNNMRKGFTHSALFVLLCLTQIVTIDSLQAQEFTLSGEVRPRTEFRNGFKTPRSDGDQAAFFTEQRSRLYLDYKDTKYKFKLVLQDVRIWGEIPQIFKEEDGNTFLSEAWGQYFFSPEWSVKAGRQIISYDNQRFFGGLEWAQQGRRHDAFIIKYAGAKSKLDLGIAINNDDTIPEPAFIQSPTAGFFETAGNYKAMYWGHYNTKFTGGSVSLLATNVAWQGGTIDAPVTSHRQTFGVIASYKAGDIKFGGDIYVQTGQFNQNDVSALLFNLNVGVPLGSQTVTFGYEFISGKDDTDTTSEITSFSPTFGTNHAFNGFMDYFFVGPANGNVGVQDLHIKTKWKVGKSALVTNLHHFLTGSTQFDANGEELGKSFGTELDLVWIKKLAGDVTFHLGYSHMIATDNALALRPGNNSSNNWAWMMFTFKPTFFKSKVEQ